MMLVIDTIVFLILADFAFVGPIHKRIRRRRRDINTGSSTRVSRAATAS